MDTFLNQWGALIMRICLSALFIVSGLQMLMNFSGTVGFIGTFVPMAAIVTVIILAVKILGGLSVLLGYKAKWGALALGVFTLLTIVMVHNNLADITQALKNLAIVGGLLMVYIHGAGSKSLDHKGQPVM